MVLQAKTRLYKVSNGKYVIYIPKGLIEDSQFPFNLEEACEKGALELVVMPSKIEGLGKLLVRPAPNASKGGDKK